jgi:hypothetical protein
MDTRVSNREWMVLRNTECIGRKAGYDLGSQNGKISAIRTEGSNSIRKSHQVSDRSTGPLEWIIAATEVEG